MRQALLALGLLFVIVNLGSAGRSSAGGARRNAAVVTWPSPKPPFYAINLAIGVMLGVLLFLTAVVEMPCSRRASLFGVGNDVPLLRLPAAAVDAHPARALPRTASGPTPVSCASPTSAG